MQSSKDLFPIFVILLSSTCFGSLSSFPGPCSSSMKKIYPGLAAPKNDDKWEWFSNGPRLTAAVGPFLFCPLVYRFGRQASISFAGFANGVLYLLLLPTNENLMTYIMVIRLIHGLIWGFLSTITLVYLIEMSSPNAYGFTGCMHQFFNVFGIVLNNILAAFVNFRTLSIICGVISFVFCGLVWVINDSRVSLQDKMIRLAKKSMRQHAKKNLRLAKQKQRRSTNVDDNNEDSNKNEDQNEKKSLFSRKSKKSFKKSQNSGRKKIRNQDDYENIGNSNFIRVNRNIDSNFVLNGEYIRTESLLQKKYLFVVVSGSFMFLFQQFSGANAILSNLSTIMAQSGLLIDPNLQSCMANAAQLIAVLVCSFLVDSFGPRIMWCISASLCVVFLVIYAVTQKVTTPHFFPVLCIFLYRLSFGLGVGPLTYATWVHLLSDSVRYYGTMILMSVHWLISWVVVITFPIMNKNITPFYTVIVYAISTFISVFYGIFFIPDNSDKETEEMALI